MVNRIVDENGELISPRTLCIPRSIELRPIRGEYIRTKDGKTRYEVLSVEWCQLPGGIDEGLLMTLRKVQGVKEKPTAVVARPIHTEEISSSPYDEPHFYLRYRCKMCGSKYGAYPEQCHSCGAMGGVEKIESEYQSLMR